ncbi:MAG: transcriptional regulator, ArsR family [Deltaproteobacteria bacterium]|nr:transcriptional regulator, ArsR family [Deltaproteobacteria bacterium]
MKSLIPFFRALADETRLRIVMLLLHGELCVCDLMAILDAPQSKLSRHLAYLKHSGIVSGRREGVWMHYSLRAPLNELYRDQIDLFRGKFSALSPFREDKRKMLKFKTNGVCGSLVAARSRRTVKKQVRVTKR